mmetsp:Transcript_130182/g.417793  ORF Transcript_130182/g.417793 Transcript_130182/m.417793 type:complete len:232 (+) Transcript_130182:116-811(+)
MAAPLSEADPRREQEEEECGLLETPQRAALGGQKRAAASTEVAPPAKRLSAEEGSLSNFERVQEFHQAFGVQVAAEPRLDVFKEDKPLIKLRRDLILEEVKELEESLDKQDLDGTVDALTDILYVVYGAGVSLGVNLDAAFDIVHRSNMSKLCKTEEVAQQTVARYQEQLAAGEGKYDSPAYRRADDGRHWVVYNESSGKVLKSIRWTEPDFSPIGVPPPPPPPSVASTEQ